MSCRLADNVQVRKESWGLLFYHQKRHKVCFVRSGDWLYPRHFDGTWNRESIIGEIAERTGAPAEIIERSLPRVTGHLAANGIIADEVC
jgi:putative mycofactocin binding protein MftB